MSDLGVIDRAPDVTAISKEFWLLIAVHLIEVMFSLSGWSSALLIHKKRDNWTELTFLFILLFHTSSLFPRLQNNLCSTEHDQWEQAVAWVRMPWKLYTMWFWNVLTSERNANSAPRISEEPWESRINKRLFCFQHFRLGRAFFSRYLKCTCSERALISGAAALSSGTVLSLMQELGWTPLAFA